MAFEGDPTRWPQHVAIPVVKSAGLMELLATAGPWTTRAGLVAAAAPDTPNAATATVTVLQHHAGAVSEELAKALVKARAEGHPGADQLAAVAARLGVHEVPEISADAGNPEPAPATDNAVTLT